MIYLFVLILLLLFCLRYDINEKTYGRDQCYIFILVILILIAGLRWRLGSDTTVYLYQFYHHVPKLWEISLEDLNIGVKPLWLLLNSVVYSLGGRFWMVQLIHAALINILLFAYFRKHCQFIFTCVFFYFIWSYFNQNMQEMKASISIVLCLYGNDYLLEKKWIKAYSLYVIASLFHFSALLMFLTPLALFLRLNKIGLLAIVLSYFVGYVLKNNFEEYLLLLDFDENIQGKAEHWAEGLDKEWTIFYYLVNVFPFVVYAVISLIILKLKHYNDTLLKFEPFIILGILTFMVQMNVRLFLRFTHFYIPYFIILFSTIICGSIKQPNGSKLIQAFRTCMYFLPLFFSISMYFITAQRYKSYLPYTSVIERKINKGREKLYNTSRDVPMANIKEY